MLPHLKKKDDDKKDEPFETMDREMSKLHHHTHGEVGDDEYFGQGPAHLIKNKIPRRSGDDDAKASTD